MSEEAPLVSIVVPCFNQAHFLGEAIDSALAQTYPAVEVVVVDDGSSDNSYEVAGRRPEVRRLRQPNRGVAAARNLGLAESRGDFTVFLDADDRLLPHAVELGMEALAKRPRIALAAGMSRDIGEDGTVIRSRRQPLVTQDHYLHLLEDCYIWSGSSVLYRRAPLESLAGFNQGLQAGDDYELYLNLARRYPIFCHDTVVTEYRRHGSNTTRDRALVLTSELRVLRRQRPRDRRERDARRTGLRRTRSQHGPVLAEQAAAAWCGQRRLEAWRNGLTLARHYPRGLLLFARRVLGARGIVAGPVASGAAP